MNDSTFLSGPWIGFYTYSGEHSKWSQGLAFTFAKGRIIGEGKDNVGSFIIAGRYDTKNRECYWTKTYVGAHDVYYRGFREGKGIWGLWEIGQMWRGGFHIWPLGSGSCDAESEQKEDKSPVEAISRFQTGKWHHQVQQPL